MKIYKIKLGVASSADQVMIMDKIKSVGHEVIQISSGLLIKSEKDLSRIKEELSPALDQASITELDIQSASKDSDLSKDARIFAGISE